MNSLKQAKGWMCRTLAVLGLVVVASVAGIIIFTIVGQPVPDILFALGAVAAGGLVRLSISPLNQ
jgi:hypothetical protein